MKKYFVLAMMAFAAIITTLGFTACSSDDDDNNTPETPKVTEVKVKTRFAYLSKPSLAKWFTFYCMRENGKQFNFSYDDGRENSEWDLLSVSVKVKGQDGKEQTLSIHTYTVDEITITSLPATYTFTVYGKMHVDLDKDIEEGDIYDFFAYPFLMVHTNLDKEEQYTRLIPADNSGYTYVPQYNFMDIKNDHSKRSDLEGKYIVTLNIDKDGNCTSTYKKEKLDDAEQK